jgi:hypothetical protein
VSDREERSGRRTSMFAKLVSFVLGFIAALVVMVTVDAKTLADWAEKSAVAMGKGARGMSELIRQGAQKAAGKGEAIFQGGKRGLEEAEREAGKSSRK